MLHIKPVPMQIRCKCPSEGMGIAQQRELDLNQQLRRNILKDRDRIRVGGGA
jgi:hypothetical protein